MKKTPEAQVLTACLRYLQARGIFHWRNNTGAVRIAPNRWISFGMKGSADILGVLPDGRFLAVECKSKRGRLSPEQKKYLSDIKSLGALAFCVRDCDELDKALCANGYAINDIPLLREK